MGKPVILQDTFSRGMVQDVPRVHMLRNSVWSAVDWLPGVGTPLRKRGGWAYASPDLTTLSAGPTYAAAVVYAPFITGAKLCAISDNSKLFTVAVGSGSYIGGCVVPVQVPVMHAEKLIIPDGAGGAPMYYDGVTTVAVLAGSPPSAKFAVVYKDRTVLAYTTAQPTYVYFSAGHDPTSWNVTNGWLSVQKPITGLASLPNALMVFQDSVTSRIRGSTPPPGTDMTLDDPIFEIGTPDARSIVTIGPYAVFANPRGIWRTNGSNIPENLTEQVGLSKHWVDTLAGYTSAWRLVAGIYRNYYVISVMNSSVFVDCVMIDLRNLTGFQLSNVKAAMFARSISVGEELYFASRSQPRVNSMSSLFSPSSSVKNDADGTAVTPSFELPMYGGKPVVKTWRNLYVTIDMRDSATDDPTMAVSYIKKPEDLNYTSLATISETTVSTRKKIPLRVSSDMVGLKFSQTGPSADTSIYAIEAEVAEREGSRLA